MVRWSETAATNPEMPERLRRLDDLYQRWPIYFVTACTAGRKALLASSFVHERFQQFAQTGPKLGAWVGAYIFMPDHFHTFVVIDDRVLSLSAWVKSLKGSLSSVLRANGATSPFWQKGFFDHVLRSGDSYSAKWEYVRDNAVRAGLVRKWEQWPYLGEFYPLEYRRM